MQSWISRLVDSDDASIDAPIVLGAAAVIIFLGLEVYSVIHTGIFEPRAFGEGISLVFAGTGVATVGQGLQRKAQSNSQPGGPNAGA